MPEKRTNDPDNPMVHELKRLPEQFAVTDAMKHQAKSSFKV
jgi:hypothetical protein